MASDGSSGAGAGTGLGAVGSGVGTAAVQLAALEGCPSYGTASSDEKLASAAGLGLDVGINYQREDFAEVIAERTGGRGVNVILDVVGAPYWDRNSASLAVRGRMVLVGTMGGGRLETNIGALMPKRLRVHGTVMRSRPLADRVAITRAYRRELEPALIDGRMRGVIDRVLASSDDITLTAEEAVLPEAGQHDGGYVARLEVE